LRPIGDRRPIKSCERPTMDSHRDRHAKLPSMVIHCLRQGTSTAARRRNPTNRHSRTTQGRQTDNHFPELQGVKFTPEPLIQPFSPELPNGVTPREPAEPLRQRASLTTTWRKCRGHAPARRIKGNITVLVGASKMTCVFHMKRPWKSQRMP
jgi:hypothetical protein